MLKSRPFSVVSFHFWMNQKKKMNEFNVMNELFIQINVPILLARNSMKWTIKCNFWIKCVFRRNFGKNNAIMIATQFSRLQLPTLSSTSTTFHMIKSDTFSNLKHFFSLAMNSCLSSANKSDYSLFCCWSFRVWMKYTAANFHNESSMQQRIKKKLT